MSAVAIPNAQHVAHYAGEDWKYELDAIEIEKCYSDRFQRPLNERWLKKHEGDAFWPPLLGTITVSWRTRRSKMYSIVDGQHRVELCRRKPLEIINAVVFVDLSIQQEAKLFSLMQRERRGITPYQRFLADLVAMEPTQMAIQKIVKDCGLELNESRDDPGYIKCVVACERVYDENPDMLRAILTLLQRTWPNLPNARAERMVRAMHIFISGEHDFDAERFVDRLSSRTPSALNNQAAQLRDGEGAGGTLPQYLARAIGNAYRTKKRR